MLMSELPQGIPEARKLEGGERICLLRNGDEVFAMADRCPHRDFNLSSGDMVAPGVIECPWHGAQFDCRTGAVLQGPATDELTLYRVQVEDGVVFVGPNRSAQ